MTIQLIKLGNYANDGTGDDLRTAFVKVNENFASLDSEITISEGANVGTGTNNVPAAGEVGVYKDKNGLFLEFKSLSSVDETVTITPSTNTVDLSVITNLSNDPAPTLSANLDLNHNTVVNGDVSAYSWGFDPRTVYNLLAVLISSNPSISIDFGDQMVETGAPHGQPYEHGFSVDMNGGSSNGFVQFGLENSYDFGTF